jgi:hypothetical protein
MVIALVLGGRERGKEGVGSEASAGVSAALNYLWWTLGSPDSGLLHACPTMPATPALRTD